MQVIHERCAALDVHKKTVVTTIMITQADRKAESRPHSHSGADIPIIRGWVVW